MKKEQLKLNGKSNGNGTEERIGKCHALHIASRRLGHDEEYSEEVYIKCLFHLAREIYKKGKEWGAYK